MTVEVNRQRFLSLCRSYRSRYTYLDVEHVKSLMPADGHARMTHFCYEGEGWVTSGWEVDVVGETLFDERKTGFGRLVLPESVLHKLIQGQPTSEEQ